MSVSSGCDLQFDSPVTLWDEAIPLGCGQSGCLLYGDGAPLKLSLDRCDLWDLRPAPEVLRKDYTYAELIRLVREGNQEEILRRFDRFYHQPTPTKIPAGRLELTFDSPEEVKSSLCLQTAQATVTLRSSGVPVRVEAFLSAVSRIGHLRISGALPRLCWNCLDFTSTSDPDIPASSLRRLGYPPAQKWEEDGICGVLQPIPDGAFALLAASKPVDGGEEIVFAVAASRDGAGWLEQAKAALRSALSEGYAAAFASHAAWWADFWNKSAVSLPDKTLEKAWYLGNYYLASCSRKGYYPMPLQGVWTADNGKCPPWKGDYHGDLNLQFSYYSFLKADHLPEGEAFLDFYAGLAEKGRIFSRSFFDSEGLCVPSVFAPDGTSLGGWPMYCTNIVNHLWELHLFYLYERYTEDETFLRDVLWRLLWESEKTVRRWLAPRSDGKWALPLSSSPEIHDNRLDSWLPSVSNYDLALLRWFYSALVETAPRVGEDPEPYAKILRLLPDYAEDETGYRISPELAVEESHRHLSHLMQVYPLNLEPADDRLRRSLETLERLGYDYWVGFSFAWMGALYARCGKGDEAVRHLRLMTDHLCSQNGFHLNGDYRRSGLTKWTYRPFTLESNMMVNDALQEMLLQCESDVWEIFPALPAAWKENCSFTGFRAPGGVKISAAADHGAVTARLCSPKARIVTLRAAGSAARALFLPAGQTVTVNWEKIH